MILFLSYFLYIIRPTNHNIDFDTRHIGVVLFHNVSVEFHSLKVLYCIFFNPAEVLYASDVMTCDGLETTYREPEDALSRTRFLRVRGRASCSSSTLPISFSSLSKV